MHEPILPATTMKELEEQDPIGYQIIVEIARRSAYFLYISNSATNRLGLEKCLEAVLDLIDTGYAKILYDEEAELLYIGYFNSSTGKYELPACMQECENEDWS